jgi:hypothetical protein
MLSMMARRSGCPVGWLAASAQRVRLSHVSRTTSPGEDRIGKDCDHREFPPADASSTVEIKIHVLPQAPD